MKKIIIVEDDTYLFEELKNLYQKAGYQAQGVDSFERASEIIIEENPDLVVLDINLPGTSGYTICKYLKENTKIPVLILTARNTLDDELESLNLGADEFLTKPVNSKRLLARSQRLLNLYDKFKDQIQVGDVKLDVVSYKLSYKNEYIIFPQTEGEILKTLMEAAPNIVEKNDLLKNVRSTIYIDENILQVNLTRIRKKLKSIGLEGVIVSKRGVGYMFDLGEENA